jgi:iron complex outermembrane receptor protein
MVVGADATYRSKQSIYPSTAQEFIVDAGTIVNARIGVKSADEWGVYFFGRNLGNNHFPRDLFPTPFQTGGLWQAFDASDRKLVGLQFDMKF